MRRALPEGFGPWRTACMRLNRWTKQGVLERISVQLMHEQELAERLAATSLDSTIIRLHPDAAGAPKKEGRKRSGARTAAGRPICTCSPATTAVR